MKQYFKNIIIFSMSAILLFVSCPLFVYASDHGGGGGTNHNPDFITDSGTINVKDDGVVMYYIEYILANIGAILKDHDLSKAMANDQTMKEYISKGKYDATEKTVTFPEETVTYVYNTFNNYAAENQPFHLEKTYKMSEIPASSFYDKAAYDYFKSYFDSDSYKYIVFNAGPYNGGIADITPVIKDGGGFVSYISSNTYHGCKVYDSNWKFYQIPANRYDIKKDENNDSYLEVEKKENWFFYIYKFVAGNTDFINSGWLVTPDGGRIRVFNTVADFINYSVGQRKIYYTSEYYNYVPEDLQVSIDDLQKTIDDMQDVIDKLLDQITNDTSESEIEELLRQIIEELKNNQGGGGGSGGGNTGGGDVNVDIDLSGTNSLLSKILAKVTQIFEKMNAAVEDAEQTALAKMQESLDEIIVLLKKIKHWTVAGTVIDAADAVADWADLLLGILKDAKEGAGSAVASIAATVGDSVDMMAQKFPFSVPWDILLFVSLLSAEPQMPYFEIPFNVELSMLDITIDYTMKLDFSQLQWLSDLSRLLLSMTYAVGLLKMTAGITSVGKEG